jgi:hypothetical protein
MAAEGPQGSVKTSLLYGVVGSLIATALVASGAWLATTMVDDDPRVEMSTSESTVGHVGYFRGRLDNYSDVAFSLDFAFPADQIIAYSISKPSTASGRWKGHILRNESIEFLLVYDVRKFAPSKPFIKSLMSVRYWEVSPRTGAVESRVSAIVDRSPIRLSSLIRQIFWFSVPFILALLSIFGINRLGGVRFGRGSEGSADGAAVGQQTKE